jgi:hemerythrin-like metal-binding protein
MNNNDWIRWVIQTAERWSDVAPIINNTGIDEIDSDHHRLVSYIIELNLLINKLESDRFNMLYINEQLRLLRKIHNYAKEHFAREERLMETFSLDLSEQQKQHKKILVMLSDAINDFQSGRIALSYDLKFNIMEWVVEHINKFDNQTFSIDNWQDVLFSAKEWSDVSFIIKKTGIPDIDDEHKELVEETLLMANIDMSQSKKTIASALRTILDDLMKIVKKHFEDEERFIQKYELLGLDAQIKQHKFFIDFMDKQCKLPDDKLVKNLNSMKKLIVEWWCKHINTLDFNTYSLSRHATEIIDNSSRKDEILWMLAQTGIKKIDEQHKSFFNYIFELHKLYNTEKKDISELKKGKERLMNHVSSHFAFEESLMEKNNRYILAFHRDEHNSILEIIKNYFDQLDHGQSTFSIYLRNKIVRLWIMHTNGIDVDTFGRSENE